MIDITLKRSSIEGPNQFKITGKVDIGDHSCSVISATASRKSEAVEKAVGQIDSLINKLQELKVILGEV